MVAKLLMVRIAPLALYECSFAPLAKTAVRTCKQCQTGNTSFLTIMIVLHI